MRTEFIMAYSCTHKLKDRSKDSLGIRSLKVDRSVTNPERTGLVSSISAAHSSPICVPPRERVRN